MPTNKIHLTKHLSATLVALAIAGGASAVHAGGGKGYAHGYGYGAPTSYTLQGECAFLPADRATEFHGNPETSKLNLGMAGNQWVVFKEAMQAFNLWIGAGNGSEPEYRPNDAGRFTLADLNDDANRYFIELIPPGQIRNQIKSGCMLLGNDEERNFLPGNFQVDFDVFASTNYNEMKNIADAGFIDEAVPYIANRLDLMVVKDNPEEIGNTDYGVDLDPDLQVQFDIAMDLLSGDIIASSLDHINEGIHNASNGYMKKVDAYINDHEDANDGDKKITMDYHLGDNTWSGVMTLTAAEWLEVALQAVATPHPDSPGAKRLISRDAGENHTSHDLKDNGCGTASDPVFCEFAVLNKFNTHESRVHHVETPGGLVRGDNPDTPDTEVPAPANGFAYVDVGFVWITELAYQLNHNNLQVQGMVGKQDIADLGIPNTDGVNGDKIYSLALLATSKNKWLGRQFIEFLRSPDGQLVYTTGGFTGLTDAQLEGGRCYAPPELVATPEGPKWVSDDSPRNGDGSCDDWLNNN